MPDELDRELLRRFVRGDQDAFESLFRQFESEVYHWILRIVRNASSTEDIVIEAFCGASVLGCGELPRTLRAIICG